MQSLSTILFFYINSKCTYPGTVEKRRQHERKSDDRKAEEKHQKEDENIRRVLEHLKEIINFYLNLVKLYCLVAAYLFCLFYNAVLRQGV